MQNKSIVQNTHHYILDLPIFNKRNTIFIPQTNTDKTRQVHGYDSSHFVVNYYTIL